MAIIARPIKWSIIIMDLGGGHYRTDAKPIIRSPLLAKKKKKKNKPTSFSREREISRIEESDGALEGPSQQRMRLSCSLSINGQQ